MEKKTVYVVRTEEIVAFIWIPTIPFPEQVFFIFGNGESVFILSKGKCTSSVRGVVEILQDSVTENVTGQFHWHKELTVVDLCSGLVPHTQEV
jgi:hypothetical protein